jgi:hypothetical protein
MQEELQRVLERFAQGLDDVDVDYFNSNIYNQIKDIDAEPELKQAVVDLHRAARHAVIALDEQDY